MGILGQWGHEGHKREKKVIVLAKGKKCRKCWSSRFVCGPALGVLGVPIEAGYLPNLWSCTGSADRGRIAT
jgi:hypothetical protein